MSEYNYENFPIDLDAEVFAAFPEVLKAGQPAPDGELTDAHTMGAAAARPLEQWRSDRMGSS